MENWHLLYFASFLLKIAILRQKSSNVDRPVAYEHVLACNTGPPVCFIPGHLGINWGQWTGGGQVAGALEALGGLSQAKLPASLKQDCSGLHQVPHAICHARLVPTGIVHVP